VPKLFILNIIEVLIDSSTCVAIALLCLQAHQPTTRTERRGRCGEDISPQEEK
jgi:hypothetical protein